MAFAFSFAAVLVEIQASVGVWEVWAERTPWCVFGVGVQGSGGVGFGDYALGTQTCVWIVSRPGVCRGAENVHIARCSHSAHLASVTLSSTALFVASFNLSTVLTLSSTA